jgi:hypothetical protein
VLGEGNKKMKKEKSMSQNNNNVNRVLVRMGARKLTENEINQVGGAAATTASVVFTNSGKDDTFDQ